MMKKIRSEDYYLLRDSGPMLLAFYSPTCGACLLASLILNEVEEKYPSLPVFTVNFDIHKHLREQYHVSTFPTLLFFYNREEISRLEGLKAKPKIMHEVEELASLANHVLIVD